MTYASILFSAMLILLTWAVANIVRSLQTRKNEPKGTPKYFFWEMNGLWNCVNALIAMCSIAFLALRTESINTESDLQLLLANIVFANVFLDVIYIIIGYFLQYKKSRSPRQRGYGTSLMMQGLFLLIFDAVLSQVLFASTVKL